MAEFPDLGQQCLQCNTLDFLPLICHYCKSIFCKDHLPVDSHNCPKYEKQSIETLVNTESQSILGKCYFCKNSVPDIELVTCLKCNKNHCLTHRHPDSHQCTEMDKKSGDSQIIKKVFTSTAPQTKGAKNEALARKVALMRLKQTAKGNAAIPMTERLYFSINYIKDSEQNQFVSKEVFLSKEWSVGKCVDWLASHFAVVNNNNNPNLPKLVICLSNDNCEQMSLSLTLKQLENDGIIHSGDKLLLKYI